jgi:SLAP domain-containing protein
MQQLVLEEKWKQTISPQDLQTIEKFFQSTSKNQEGVVFTPIRHARNHRNELLCSVIIHNFTDDKLSLIGSTLQLFHNDTIIAEESFHDTRLLLQPRTSMPWTFIYPNHPYLEQHPLPTEWSIKII